MAYGYSVVATLAPEIFPASLRTMGGLVPVYFEAAAVITTLVLLGQVLELRARSATGKAIRALLGLAPKTARRVDPDGNTWNFLHSRGGQNDGKYANPEVDRLLDQARVELDPAARRALYARMWEIALGQDRARIYLWHRQNIVAHSVRLQGFVPVADGLIRPQDLRLN